MSSRVFLLPDNRGYVLFTQAVLAHMYRHAQTRIWQREAGGQLFSPTPALHSVVITAATGPHAADSRSRCGFNPNLALAIRDRQEEFALGRHPVGLWHTHPESYPTPSGQDQKTTEEYLAAFGGVMDGFLLSILGNRGNPLNLTVWLASSTGASWLQLPESQPAPSS